MMAFTLLMAAIGGEPAKTIPPPPVITPAPIGSSHSSLRIPASPNGVSSLVSLFSTDDYPAEAIRAGEQGATQVRLLVTTDGRVGNCEIVATSGSRVLDSATCNILQGRARFNPALDDVGRATTDFYTFKVRWELPATRFRDSWVKTVVPVNGARALGQCRVEIIQADRDRIPACPKQLLDAAGRIVASAPVVEMFANRELVFEHGTLIGDSSQLDFIGQAPGEQLLRLTGLGIKVDSDGSVVSCDIIKVVGGPSEFPSDLCKMQLNRLFEALAASDPYRQPRTAVVYMATYLRMPAAIPATDLGPSGER